jgi:hypothetical protein
MPKVKISEYSSTANSNTDVASINIDEGCAPSGINNAIRAVMGHLKDFQTGAVSDPLTVGGVLTVTGGSAGTPAITTSGDTNTGIFFPAADTIAFSEGGVEAMRIDASGRLGLGVTPSAWDSNVKPLQLTAGSVYSYGTVDLELTQNCFYNTSAQWIYNTTAPAERYQMYNGTHVWYNAPSGTAGNTITFTQAMTLDASGNLLVGTTSSGQPDSNFAQLRNIGGPSGVNCLSVGHITGTSSGTQYAYFVYGGLGIGSITQNGTTAVAYNTSSDYRLKENIQPMTGALAKVAALKPVTYKWKSDGSDGEGFIAHELAEVVPQCVAGEKDAVDANGKPKYQGIDTSFLVATLTAAIQEQQALITQLQADVAALKA